MTPQDALAQEWTTLQTQHERYEIGGLVIKLASVVLTVAGSALHLNGKLMLCLLALLWLQEGIYRTFQSRLGQRLLRVEALIKRAANESDRPAFQLHSEWAAGRPGVLGLMLEYARSACRPHPRVRKRTTPVRSTQAPRRG